MDPKTLKLAGLVLLLIGGACLAINYAGSIFTWTQHFLNGLITYSTGNATAGEWLNITVSIKGGAQASWLASATGEAWLVDGNYYPNQMLQMWLEITITYTNVENITIDDAYILCSEQSNPSQYYELYDLADNEPVSGPSPITWTSNVITRSFDEFIRQDLGYPLDSLTVLWHIAASISGDGTITGQHYTVSTGEVLADQHEFTKKGESLSGEAALKLQFASWLNLIGGAGVAFGLFFLVLGYYGHTIQKKVWAKMMAKLRKSKAKSGRKRRKRKK